VVRDSRLCLEISKEWWRGGVLEYWFFKWTKTSNFRIDYVNDRDAHKSNPAPFAVLHQSITPKLQKVIER
jgi:hypothetical protein